MRLLSLGLGSSHAFWRTPETWLDLLAIPWSRVFSRLLGEAQERFITSKARRCSYASTPASICGTSQCDPAFAFSAIAVETLRRSLSAAIVLCMVR